MTDEELAAIKARAAYAEQGPWIATRGRYGPIVWMGAEGASAHFEGEVDFPVWNCDDPQDGCMGEQESWMADAAFIAHAREDVPALIAELERWREIGRVVAGKDPEVDIEVMIPEWQRTCCPVCGEGTYGIPSPRPIEHTSDCIVTKARALLGMGKESEPPIE